MAVLLRSRRLAALRAVRVSRVRLVVLRHVAADLPLRSAWDERQAGALLAGLPCSWRVRRLISGEITHDREAIGSVAKAADGGESSDSSAHRFDLRLHDGAGSGQGDDRPGIAGSSTIRHARAWAGPWTSGTLCRTVSGAMKCWKPRRSDVSAGRRLPARVDEPGLDDDFYVSASVYSLGPSLVVLDAHTPLDAWRPGCQAVRSRKDTHEPPSIA